MSIGGLKQPASDGEISFYSRRPSWERAVGDSFGHYDDLVLDDDYIGLIAKIGWEETKAYIMSGEDINRQGAAMDQADEGGRSGIFRSIGRRLLSLVQR